MNDERNESYERKIKKKHKKLKHENATNKK